MKIATQSQKLDSQGTLENPTEYRSGEVSVAEISLVHHLYHDF